MAKGQPFSIRLDEATELLVEAEARRTRRSKSAIVEAFTEEAARLRRFPGIAFRSDDVNRRAWVVGSGLDVWEIVQMAQALDAPESMAEETQLSASQVRLALAYRKGYPEEIDRFIAENDQPLDALRVLFPFIEVVEV